MTDATTSDLPPATKKLRVETLPTPPKPSLPTMWCARRFMMDDVSRDMECAFFATRQEAVSHMIKGILADAATFRKYTKNTLAEILDKVNGLIVLTKTNLDGIAAMMERKLVASDIPFTTTTYFVPDAWLRHAETYPWGVHWTVKEWSPSDGICMNVEASDFE